MDLKIKEFSIIYLKYSYMFICMTHEALASTQLPLIQIIQVRVSPYMFQQFDLHTCYS